MGEFSHPVFVKEVESLNILNRVNNVIEYILRKTCSVLLMCFASIVLLQVIARNYLKMSFTWTVEMSLFFFLWSVYLGAAVALRNRTHYIVEIFPSSWKKINLFLDILSDLLIMSIIFVLVWGGYNFTLMGMSRYCSSIAICQAWLMVAMPISGVAMSLFGVENILKDISSFRKLMKGVAD